MVKLDLQHNELVSIPRCLLELPSLNELILSHNRITELPDIHEWAVGLTVLDLSFNDLSNLPHDVVAPSLRTLNIGSNKYRVVPPCVCSFTSLQYLDISNNPDILSLPVEMGRLSNLTRLNLMGLKDLSDPPRNVQRDARDCIRYLNSKLRSAKKFYRMKLMLVGKQNRGKTTLVARLQGLDLQVNQSTVGVDVTEWSYGGGFGRRRFQFSIWDFGGQEEYYATHQCFLSERSMYLLLWDITHGEAGVNELKPWLDNITLRAPRSCVIIVGTHLDKVDEDQRSRIDELLQQVAHLAGNYSKLVIPEVLAVGLKNRLENIGNLREAIYTHAANYKIRNGQPIMGQEIPASYFQLNRELELIQQKVRENKVDPVMHADIFKDVVQQMKLPDIHSEEELKTATLFLNEVGTILHYDDCSHNLNELYFIEPRWLCDMMAKVVTIRERNPFIRRGILHSKDIPQLFRDERFPWQYFEQYLMLLDRFEIALPLDNRRILVPSMLPEERPPEAVLPDSDANPLYRRYITFGTPTPPGFWSRLISRVMHSVAQVCRALDLLATCCDSSSAESCAPLDVGTVTDEASAQMIGPTPPTTPTSSGSEPFILPFVQRITQDTDIDDDITLDNMRLEYWKEGILYQDPDLCFSVESLTQAKVSSKSKRVGGILIQATPNSKGIKVICQLVDMISQLVHEWYPGLEDSSPIGTGGMEQRVPCYECRKLGREIPFEFKIDQYMSLISASRTKLECGYDSDASKNHMAQLQDIMPDLLLQDLDAEFLLKAEEIHYQEDSNSLLGKGGFGKVYRGKCRSKSVAIKKYLTRTEDAFAELRAEAKVLQKSHHPCLVCLVGVSVHPLMALVLEEAPLGSLENHLIKKDTPIARVVIFRMAAQVAAAIRFLHKKGIIFRDLKAANVLLWSLDPEALCHCKVTDFGIATHAAPFGALGIQGTKGFIAPEVLYIGKRKAVYNHKADVFSFGMLMYQMIARRHPYHDVQPVKIDAKVLHGDRPSFVDRPVAEVGFYYLTRLMEQCWHDNPSRRPETDEIIGKLANINFQAGMSVIPVRSRFSLRRAVAITPHHYAQANTGSQPGDLWVCCDGAEGAELNIYSINKMVKVSKNFIKENQVQCMCVCGDHVWVCSRAGIEYGVVDIFSISSRELVHNIRMRENSVSCITCSESTVYLGTLEGYCFAFNIDLKAIQANVKPKYKYVSENAVDGIAVTKKHVWVSHTKLMYFLNLQNLQLEHSFKRIQNQDAFIGQLATSSDGSIVWSAHLGGCILSAWNGEMENHLYDINTQQLLINVIHSTDFPAHDCIMTTMTPGLDTVWVGMATGHILVIYNQQLMTYIKPYKEYIRFLCPVPCAGPCGTEKCMVVSGAKSFQSLFPDMPAASQEPEDEKGQPVDRAGVLLLWEAHSGQMMMQMRAIEKQAENGFFLESHTKVKSLIREMGFKDATHILEDSSQRGQERGSVEKSVSYTESVRDSLLMETGRPLSTATDEPIIPAAAAADHIATSPEPIDNPTPTETFMEGQPFSFKEDAYRFQRQAEEQAAILVQQTILARTSSAEPQDVFLIEIQGSQTDEGVPLKVRVTCSKPASFKKVLQELSKEKLEGGYIGYRQIDSGMFVKITGEDEFSRYINHQSRPQLMLVPK